MIILGNLSISLKLISSYLHECYISTHTLIVNDLHTCTLSIVVNTKCKNWNGFQILYYLTNFHYHSVSLCALHGLILSPIKAICRMSCTKGVMWFTLIPPLSFATRENDAL